MIVGLLLVVLSLLFVFDALKKRRALGCLGRISLEQPHLYSLDGFKLFVGKGKTISDQAMHAALGYMKEHNLKLLCLIPEVLGGGTAMKVAQNIKNNSSLLARFAPVTLPVHAMALSQTLMNAAAVPESLAGEPAEMNRWFNTCRDHAGGSFVSAILSGLFDQDDPSPLKVYPSTEYEDEPQMLTLCFLFFIFLFMAFGFLSHPFFGLLAIIAYSLQPFIICGGNGIQVSSLGRYMLGRFPVTFFYLFKRLFLGHESPAPTSVWQKRQEEYAAQLEGGIARFFEKRREECPFCGSKELRRHITSADFLQQKPGIFYLERCASCRYVLQNPRLNADGLNFYYKDFYDGLNGDLSESLLSSSFRMHFDQARMLQGLAHPKSWLDVGAGYGHFSVIARQVWPETRMDGLDIGESIFKAKARGWIDRAYSGFITDLAPSFTEKYDVVSMIHYLEHTQDPKIELITAAGALAAHGHLLIELPNVEHRLSSMLGCYWLPWFQPQHLNFPAKKHLAKWLDDAGFDLVKVEFDRVHQSCDFTFALIFLLKKLAPFDRPWRQDRVAPWRRGLVWLAGIPFLLVARVLDKIYGRFFAKGERMVNNYRLLAVKRT